MKEMFSFFIFKCLKRDSGGKDTENAKAKRLRVFFFFLWDDDMCFWNEEHFCPGIWVTLLIWKIDRDFFF